MRIGGNTEVCHWQLDEFVLYRAPFVIAMLCLVGDASVKLEVHALVCIGLVYEQQVHSLSVVNDRLCEVEFELHNRFYSRSTLLEMHGFVEYLCHAR